MNILLDSHSLLWVLYNPRQLKPAAARAITEPRNAVFYSAASAWELELKAAKGKLKVHATWLDAADRTGLRHLPVTAAEAQASAWLPWHHSDPFDRLLVAQAQAHGLTIATRDPLLLQYGVPVLEV